MTRPTCVVLDAGPLSLVSHPAGGDEAEEAALWLEALIEAGIEVVIPEIADYELRRELIRADKQRSIERLDELASILRYQPLTTEIMRRSAELWAKLRNESRATAPDLALDADVILAAQARAAGADIEPVVVATTNVGHLSRLTPAAHWREIQP